jgi:hypothetical protein
MIEIMNTDDDFIAKFMNIVIAVDVSYRNFPVRGKLIRQQKITSCSKERTATSEWSGVTLSSA